ncbi:MAG: hypothetical protein VXX85_06395 [Candidatus Margulisiibacteriota bacterium]|nr:hypothetical protein [Candidatus Margulisiibacteriota bacterium]
MYAQTNLLPLSQKLNALPQSTNPPNLRDFNKELAFVSSEMKSKEPLQKNGERGFKNPNNFSRQQLFSNLMNNEGQIRSMLTTLESLDYSGKLDLTASFKDVNSSWGIASIINMSFDSSKQGMQTFLSVLMIIITKVKELDSTNTSGRESPNTVTGLDGFDSNNISDQHQTSNNKNEVKKSSMLKKVYKGILNRLYLRQKKNSKKP